MNKLIIFHILMLIPYLVLAQLQHTNGCDNLQNAFDTFCPRIISHTSSRIVQGSPGKRGAIGQKGQKGESGSTGPTGIVDYDRVEEVIQRKIRQAMEDHTDALAKAIERIRKLEVRQGFCPVKYADKCFWMEVRYEGVRAASAQSVCEQHGGSLADIYSEMHFNMVTRYMRSLITPSTSDWLNTWIGLTFNTATKQVSLSNGTAAPYVKWHSGNPKLSRSSPIVLLVRSSVTTTAQNMWNAGVSYDSRGVLCEK